MVDASLVSPIALESENHLHGLRREELRVPPVSSPQAIHVSRLLSVPVLLGRSGPDRGIPNAHLPSTVSTETKHWR